MGMQWATEDAQSKGADKAVVNMSLGGAFSQTSNDAAKAIAEGGVFLAVAAGNDNVSAFRLRNVATASFLLIIIPAGRCR